MRWKYFAGDYYTMEALRQHFHRLCLELHPDKHADDKEKYTKLFQEMYAEYEEFLRVFVPRANAREEQKGSKFRYTVENEEEITRVIERIVRFTGIVIEICGSWIWVSGDTYQWRVQLKNLGFRWQHTKKMWYFAGYEWKPRRTKTMTMEHIRAKYGSVVIEASDDELQALAGA